MVRSCFFSSGKTTVTLTLLMLLWFLGMGTAFNTASAQPATGLNFDGIDDYIECPDISSAFTTGQVCGEAWVYGNSSSSWGSIMKNWTEATGGAFEFGGDPVIDTLSVCITQLNGVRVCVKSFYGFPSDAWWHVAFSADGTMLHLYVSGTEIGIPAPYDGTLYAGVSTTYIGATPSDSQTGPSEVNPGFWSGSMDEVRIWNRGLCLPELQEHMYSELLGTEDGLVAYYKFNQGVVGGDNSSENTLVDATGNSHHATLINFALNGASSNWITSSELVGTFPYFPFTLVYTFYSDADGDGQGNPNMTIQTCQAAVGYVSNNTDCNDGNAAIYQGATENCNYIDDDCDGMIDEGGCSYWYFDGDDDNFGVIDSPLVVYAKYPSIGYAGNPGDCDDTNPSINPGVTDICNGIDDNCDGQDEGCFVYYTFYLDIDGDGYGVEGYQVDKINDSIPPDGYATLSGDCNDSNHDINPGGLETCNGVDDDCDGSIDDDCLILYIYYYDGDQDGYGKDDSTISSIATTPPTGYVTANGDCNDGNNAVKPGATEVCGNGVDDNCDGNDDMCLYTYYYDADGDGYGDEGYTPLVTYDAIPPDGWATTAGDCDNGNADINPGATEVCNFIDDNCDGVTDDACGSTYTYYFDGDGDGYGDSGSPLTNYDETPPVSYSAIGDDCNDGDATVNPGATEVCSNGVDDDCNGTYDDCTMYSFVFDADGDGYGGDFWSDFTDPTPPEHWLTIGGDCYDFDPAINPDAAEQCNGFDDNCNGTVDEGCILGQLPDFTKDDIYGVTHHFYGDLAAGNAVIIEFSAGWCVPSQITEPEISKVYDDICQGNGNIKLYDIVFENESPGNESDDAYGFEYANHYNATYPIFTGTRDLFISFAVQYSQNSIPWFLVVIPDTSDPANSTVHQIIGAESDLKDLIENILTSNGYEITPPPSLTITVDGDVCDLPSPVTLTSNQASGNLWSTGETTQSITITAAGDYTLSYAAGCGTITKKIHTAVPAAGTLTSLGGNTACAGGNGLLTLDYSGGSQDGTLEFSLDGITWDTYWPGFYGTRIFLNTWNAGTTVYFRVSESVPGSVGLPNCTAYSEVVQIVSQQMTDPALEITASGSDCSFPLTLNSSYPDNNQWSTGETTASISAGAPEYYYVLNNATCGMVYDDITISAGVTTWYQDADNDGFGNAAFTLESCIQPGGYVFDGSDCNDEDASIHPFMTESCNSLDDNCDGAIDEGCDGYTYYFDGDQDDFGTNDFSFTSSSPTAPFGYTEVSGDCNDGDPYINPAALDICNGEDDNCDGIVDENGLQAVITPGGNVNACKGSPVTLTANTGDGIQYTWYRNGFPISGATSSSYTVKKSGNYQVNESSLTCSSTSPATDVTVNTLPPAAISHDGLDLCETGSVVLTANAGDGFTYQWKKGQNIIEGATDQSYVTAKKGTYKVIVTSSAGCSKTSAGVKVTKLCKTGDEDSSDELMAGELSLYPNPTTGVFALDLSLSNEADEEVTIQIYNSIGQLVHQEYTTSVNGTLKQQIHLPGETPEGLYMIRVIVGNELYSQQLIVQE